MPDYLIPHKAFTGNRPSLSIMMPNCTAYTVGQLLSMYEHRVAVQVSGWVGGGWGCLVLRYCAREKGVNGVLPTLPSLAV